MKMEVLSPDPTAVEAYLSNVGATVTEVRPHGFHRPYLIPRRSVPPRTMQDVRDRRYIALMRAEAAFHQAMSASIISAANRVLSKKDAAVTDAHLDAVAHLIARTDALMCLPIRGKGDMSERRRLLKRFGRACTTYLTGETWKAWKKQWESTFTMRSLAFPTRANAL